MGNWSIPIKYHILELELILNSLSVASTVVAGFNESLGTEQIIR